LITTILHLIQKQLNGHATIIHYSPWTQPFSTSFNYLRFCCLLSTLLLRYSSFKNTSFNTSLFSLSASVNLHLIKLLLLLLLLFRCCCFSIQFRILHSTPLSRALFKLFRTIVPQSFYTSVRFLMLTLLLMLLLMLITTMILLLTFRYCYFVSFFLFFRYCFVIINLLLICWSFLVVVLILLFPDNFSQHLQNALHTAVVTAAAAATYCRCSRLYSRKYSFSFITS